MLFFGGQTHHIGLLVRRTSTETTFVDLQWHHRVVERSPEPQCVSSKLDIPQERLLALRAFARNVIRHSKDRPIPYGIDFTQNAFERETGLWLHGPTGRGLTCATFVVAVLAAAGFPFLDVTTWTARQEDRAWVEKICQLLSEHGAPEQADHIRGNEQGVRLRPAEVAGGAREPASAWSVTFARALERSTEIETEWEVVASPPST